jgi:hypothetical protein
VLEWNFSLCAFMDLAVACCCTIYNICLIYTILSKVKKRKQEDKGHVFKEKWEDVLL